MVFGIKFKEIPELFEAVHLASTPYSKEPFQLDNTDVKPKWFEELISRRLIVAVWNKDSKFWRYEYNGKGELPLVIDSDTWIVKVRFPKGADEMYKFYSNETFLEKFESAES